jgi:tetratricopeptide (TPR) repeat protein
MPARNRRNKITMTADEFNDFIWRFEDQDEDKEKDENTAIAISEKIYRASLSADIDVQERDYYKKDYIRNLLTFAKQTKSKWRDHGRLAEEKLKKALFIEKNLPLAYYRLGHIHFRRTDYATAVPNFQKALEGLDQAYANEFSLEDLQIENARWILSYCALQTFNQYKPETLDNAMYPELSKLITHYSREDGFTRVMEQIEDGKITKKIVNREEYLQITQSTHWDCSTAFIDYTDGQPEVGYHGTVSLSPLSGDLLIAIIKGDQNKLVRQMRRDITNTFNQKIRRLRLNLAHIGLEPPEFELINNRGSVPKLSTDLTIYIFTRLEEQSR